MESGYFTTTNATLHTPVTYRGLSTGQRAPERAITTPGRGEELLDENKAYSASQGNPQQRVAAQTKFLLQPCFNR